eukprot:11114856-Lingulodinium_polyedra.AAC.1
MASTPWYSPRANDWSTCVVHTIVVRRCREHGSSARCSLFGSLASPRPRATMWSEGSARGRGRGVCH